MAMAKSKNMLEFIPKRNEKIGWQTQENDLVRLFFEKRKKVSEEKRKEEINRGILYTSGLIAGEGLIGILLAVFAVIPIGTGRLSDIIDLSGIFAFDSSGTLQVILAIIVYGLLIFSLFQASFHRKKQ